jgi:5-methylthioadenosine/S-adenosylhomocysteine deaminase
MQNTQNRQKTQIQGALVSTGEDYETVDVQLQGTEIAAISPASDALSQGDRQAEIETIDATDKLLLPGFVNAHTHSFQAWQRGLIAQRPLELWLADLIDTAPSTPEQYYLGALSTAVNTLLSGGTCIMDHSLLILGQERESLAALVRGYREVGIRVFIAPLLQDQPLSFGLPQGRSLPHRPYPQTTQMVLETLESLVQEFHDPEHGINIAVGATGFQRCSDDLFRGCVELSDRYNLCRHTHVLETRAQQKLAMEKYGGGGLAHLHSLGFLDHRTSLAHCVWLGDRDIELLVETRATVVHNPVSNLRLGSGIAPILRYLDAGVNVTFGCDGAASNDSQDLLEAIKLGTILQCVTETDYRRWITPRRAIALATQGGAQGMNLAGQTGAIAVGYQADCVLYNLTDFSMLPLNDPLQMLVLGRPTQVVDSVWVRGKRLVADGKVLTVDMEGLRQELIRLSRDRPRPVFTTLKTLETHYRRVMQLPE